MCFGYRIKYENSYLINHSKFKCKIDIKKMRNQINNIESFNNTKNFLLLEIVKIYNEIKQINLGLMNLL